MAGEEKAEVDRTIDKHRVVVDRDWISTTAAFLGITLAFVVTAVQLVHLARGKFEKHAMHRNVFGYVFSCYLIFLATWVICRVNDRALKFAFGLLGAAMLWEVAASLFWTTFPGVVTPALFFLRLGGFVFLAFYGIRWFTENVKVA